MERPEDWQGSSIYLRQIKEGQAKVSEKVLEEEVSRGFKSAGAYRQRMRYFADGMAIGTEAFLLEQLAKLREAGQVQRRRHAAVQMEGLALSLREQRSNAVEL